MFGFQKLSGGTVDSKNQLLQLKHAELVKLDRDQCKAWGLVFAGINREEGVFRAGVLKEQIAGIAAAESRKAEAAETERRAEILAVASMHPNCFAGSDE